MNEFVNTEGHLDSVFTEIEVGYLPEFISTLRSHEIDALVVLGPDINCKKNRGRTLRTMHPWSLHRAAKAMSTCDDMMDMDFESAPLVSWVNLDDKQVGQTKWAPLWKINGFRSMLLVKIPIAMDRHFECMLFSKREEHSSESAASVIYKTMTAWPKIKLEIVKKQQLLTRQEQLVLRLSAMGATSQQAAARCETSERMVNFHMGAILKKLNAQNKTAAVLKAIMMGIL